MLADDGWTRGCRCGVCGLPRMTEAFGDGRSRWWTRRKVVGAFGAVVLGGVGCTLFFLGPLGAAEDSAERAPTGFPEASRATAIRTLEYLRDQAPELLVMHRAATEAHLISDPGECARRVKRLDRVTPADRALIKIGGVFDEPLSAAFAGERAALGAHLTACSDGQQTGNTSTKLRVASELVDHRLIELNETE